MKLGKTEADLRALAQRIAIDNLNRSSSSDQLGIDDSK